MRNTFQNFKTAATHAIEPNGDSRGVYSALILKRITINNGQAGTITLVQSDDTSSDGDDTRIGAITVPSSQPPVSIDFDIVVNGNLLLTLSAATDITVVYELIP